MDYKYDYFISYARRDNEDGFVDLFVENLEKNLKLRGLFGKKPSVFFDKETICNMDNWERKIREGIRTSRFMVVLLSPNFFQRVNCAREFQWWLDREIHQYVFDEGVAAIRIGDVQELYDTRTINIDKEALKHCPHWASELYKRQSSGDFDLTTRDKDKIDNALAALYDASSSRVWRQDTASNSPHNSLYLHYNENFVGRREYLVNLRDNLNSRRRVALHGLGGVGKTELALAYGRSFAWDYQLGRVYIKCENQTSLISAILGSELDTVIRVNLQGDEEKRLTTLLNALSQRRNFISAENEKNARPTNWGTRLLLILDNVSDPNIFKSQDLDLHFPHFLRSHS